MNPLQLIPQGNDKTSGTRMYKGAEWSRLVQDWVAMGTSQDAEVRSSLRMLRNRSRQLCRDNDYAKNAMRQVKNNVVGRGVGMKPKFKQLRGGRLNEPLNDQVARLWKRWGRKQNCHTAGLLSFSEIERMLIGAVAESGEVLVRLVYQKFGDSPVPLTLEIIESDQLIDELNGIADNGEEIRMGIQRNKWGRPTYYWFYPRHPGDYQFQAVSTDKYLKIAADEIIHLATPDRVGGTRGVPWFHTAMTRLRHMGGFEEAEVIKARGQASMMGFIETPDGDTQDDGTISGQRVSQFEPGKISALGPGEKFTAFTPTSPGAQFDPFIRAMLRGVSAGIGLSYEGLSKDYSQSSYSSSRLALLDDRDNWQVLQDWMIEQFHQRIFEAWLNAAVLAGALVIPAYELNRQDYAEAVMWSARGWSWIDPWKEVQAYRTAVRSGLMTLSQAVEQTNGRMDMEELYAQRQREVELARELGIVLDTDPSQVSDKGMAQRYPTSDAAATEPGAIESGDDADPTADDENDNDGGDGTETEQQVQNQAATAPAGN